MTSEGPLDDTIEDLLEDAPAADGGELFDGVEDVETEVPGAGTPDQRELEAADTFGMLGGSPRAILAAVWHDLDFREAHAILVGFLPVALGVALGSPTLLGASIALSAAALGYCGVGPLKGLCDRESGRLVVAVRWAIKEPHYLLGGQLGGLLGGSLLRAVLVALDVATTHLTPSTALSITGLAIATELTRRLYRILRA